MHLISIIIPICNCQKYFESCFHSVLKQSYKNIEIILVNNEINNTETKKIIGKVQDTRVKYYEQTKQGVSAARNLGLKKASGEYILFLDSDDVLEINACEILINAINSNQEADIIFFNFMYHNNNRKGVFYYQNLDLKPILMKTLPFNKISNKILNLNYVVWNKLYKTNFLKNNKIIFNEDYSFCEDMLFSIELFAQNPKISLIYNIIHNYTIRNDGLSSISAKEMFDILIKIYNHVIQQPYYKDKYKNFIDNMFLKANIFITAKFKDTEKILLNSETKNLLSKIRKQGNVNIFNSFRYRKLLQFIIMFKKT